MDNPVFFYDPVAVDPAMIVDWSYADASDAPIYGRFALRQDIGDDVRALLESGFAPAPVPPAWQ